MKITEMEGKVLKKVVKRFMVLVLVITLATCNTGTGFSLVKAEEIVETKEKTEVRIITVRVVNRYCGHPLPPR